jgi:phospholipid/cholesterol/gamma-HCH transport system substrate-binding protein
METSAPSLGKVLSMALFALSCVGLLIFLWVEFGGTIPFNAQGYRFEASFPYAQELATPADVRIAGVSVGKVVSTSLDPKGNRTIATIQLNNQYAPIRRDATAILRTKTILGETYVELAPGQPNAPPLPDGAMLPRGQVQQAVQLDEVFNALDPTTRRAFQIWQQQLGQAVQGNDQNLNSVFGNLPTFAADASDILQVLDVQHASVVKLVRNGGTVFNAIARDPATLRNLITTGETTFNTTATNNAALAATFKVFPEFLTQTRLTMARLKTFSLDADPLVKELIPVAQQLSPTLNSVKQLSPPLESLFINLRPLINASKAGLPAIANVLTGARPLLGALAPFLEQLNPVLNWLSLHQQLISDFISDGGSALASTPEQQSGFGGGTGHALPQLAIFGPETVSIWKNRSPDNRGNTYRPPIWGADPTAFNSNVNAAAPPEWDCNNAGGDVPPLDVPIFGHMSCRTAPPLGALIGQPNNKFPHVLAAKYPSH